MNRCVILLALLTTAGVLSAQTTDGTQRTNSPAPKREFVLTSHASKKVDAVRLTVVTTNSVLYTGTLVSQSASNLVLSSFGVKIEIPRSQIKWCETNLVTKGGNPPGVNAAAASSSPSSPSTNSSASVIAEFNKPQTEDEMRMLLQTQEGQALVQSIVATYIGNGTDAGTIAARDSFFNNLQQFQSGNIGILEIQGQAQGVLGQLGQYDKEIANDPLAAEWNEYKDILRGFTSEPPPATKVEQGR